MEYLHPTVVKEYKTKRGTQEKHTPLYANYLFLKYNATDELSEQILDCMWIKYYVGKCTFKEIEEVRELSKQRYDDLIVEDDIVEGCQYKLSGTAF